MKLKLLAVACVGLGSAASVNAQNVVAVFGGAGTAQVVPLEVNQSTTAEQLGGQVAGHVLGSPYQYDPSKMTVGMGVGPNGQPRHEFRAPAERDAYAQSSAGTIYAYKNEVYLHSAAPTMGLKLSQSLMGNMNDRLGTGALESSTEREPWARVIMGRYRHQGDTTRSGATRYDATNKNANGAKYDMDIYGLQFGTDLYRDDRNRVGAFVGFGQGRADVSARSIKMGRNTVNTQALGAYYTHVDPSGWYVDSATQLSFSQYQMKKLGGRVKGEEDMRTKGYGLALQGETGYRFALSNGFAIVPKVGLDYHYTDLSNPKANKFGPTPTYKAFHSADARTAVRGEVTWDIGSTRTLTAFIEPGVAHELGGSAKTRIARGTGSAVTVNSSLGGTRATVTAGLQGSLTASTSVMLGAGYEKGLSKNGHDAVTGQLSLRTTF